MLLTELTQAMSKRHLRRLERAINAAVDAGLEEKLGLQMKMARRILEQLRRIERLRHDILALDQKTIAEIKSYSKPPEPVYRVMKATFVLLGEDVETLEVGALDGGSPMSHIDFKKCPLSLF